MTNEIEHKRNICLKQGERYYIRITSWMVRFNTTTLLLEGTSLDEMGQIHLADGQEVLYLGTAGELKLTGDVTPDTQLFKPGQEIIERYNNLKERHLLRFDSTIEFDQDNS
jgi:hypothetical protein